MSPTLSSLLCSSSPADRTALQLRMLYSKSFAAQVRAISEDRSASCDPRVAAFLRTVNFDRLALEQAARLRNMARGLGDSFPSSWPALSLELRRELVALAVEDPAFWQFPGRALSESFAMAAWRALHQRGMSFLADLIRLEGTLSGILAALALPPSAPVPASPWRSLEGAEHESQEGAESFRACGQLLDDSGELPLGEAVSELGGRPPHPHRIALIVEDDGIAITCARL